MPASTKFTEKVWAAAKRVPRGKVATYADIARLIGRRGAIRAVGNALHKNPHAGVPCHRIVRADGDAGGYARGRSTKIRKLVAEGVRITNGKIDLSVFRKAS